MQIRGEPTASISAISAPGDDLVARNSTKHAWTIAIALILLVTALRLAYMIWLSPYQLVGDEAYYWVQGRHLELCYDEKGPALPWIVYGCCKIFGDTEWAVRLPMVIAFALSAWGVGKIAINISRGDERVGLLAVICFCLLPAFQANAQLSTQDGPLITIWVALTAIGLRLIRRWHADENVWLEWMLIWIVVGIGFLFKQTSLLFLPSFAIYWLIHWRTLKLRAVFFAQQFVGVILFLIVITPIIIWNSRHGWPMLAHTLGHLGAGGDQAGLVNSGNPLSWLGSTLGGIVGSFGPAFLLLMFWACKRSVTQRNDDVNRWHDRLWLMCAALPSILFFVLLSFKKPVVPSWPLPHFVPLVVLVAELLVSEVKSQPLLRASWNTLIIYGLIAQLIIFFPTMLGHLPIVGKKFEHSLVARFSGHREAAAKLQTVLADIKTPDGQPPLVITRHYMEACLDTFYLPTHPTIYTAGKYLAKRSTTFDQWPDTDLTNPALHGRTLLLIGQGDVPWEAGLIFGVKTPISGGAFFLAPDYAGPRPDYPRMISDSE